MSVGWSLHKAAIVMGIPKEEAIAWAEERLKAKEETDFSLKLVAEAALKTSLAKLQELAKEGPRITTQGGADGQVCSNTDLEAAKALAKLAIDALKINTRRAPKDNGPPLATNDFWDQAGAWQLKKPGAE